MTFKRDVLRWLYRELDTRSLDKEGAQIFTDVIAYVETLDGDAGADDVIGVDGHRAHLRRTFLQRRRTRIREAEERLGLSPSFRGDPSTVRHLDSDEAKYCAVCRQRGRLSSLESYEDGSQVCLRCDWRSGEPIE